MFPTGLRSDKPFTVPRVHAGQEDNNFVTKILDIVRKDVGSKIWPAVRPVVTRGF